MSSSRKKVVVRRFSRDWVAGFVDMANFLTGSGLEARLELLEQDGRLSSLPLNEVKMVCFVREFEANASAVSSPERLVKKTFSGRPRTEGVWVRMTFRDNDVLEGIAPNDVSLLELQGVQVTPPDLRSNTQRIYVPRVALTELVVVGVISAPGVRRKTPVVEDEALDLFSGLSGNTRPN
jgi:hypothetical protein